MTGVKSAILNFFSILSPRTGRPTDNPKSERITVRLDKESSEILNSYCNQEQIERAEAIRREIKKLSSDIKKSETPAPTDQVNASVSTTEEKPL